MDNALRLWAVVPAAGIGRRMGASIPKQYLMLGGQSILQVTLNKLLAVPYIKSIVVSVATSDHHFSQQVQPHERILRVPGGAERSDSVFNALVHIDQLGGGDDWVLVHDAARPCVSSDRIDALVKYVASHQQGAILAAPAADTIKFIERDRVQKTLNRNSIYMAHTPQIFPVRDLLEALCYCQSNNIVVTDESLAMEATGSHPFVIEDTRDNIKVTREEDLGFAEFVLRKQGCLDVDA